jgi:hypothetical protein
MNITELIEDLELDAMASQDAGRDDTLSMRAAGVLRKLHAVLTPFAEAAEKADKASEDQERLIGSRMGSLASPGWGIRRFHLDAAREILWKNV